MKRFSLFFFLYFFVVATGASGLVYQVAWQKYLQRLLGADNVATAVILGIFLGGLSVGYYLCGLYTTRVRNHFRAYAYLELAIGAWCLLFPFFFDYVEAWTARWSFDYPYLMVFQGLVVSFVLMGLPTICMGGTIPFLTKALTTHVSRATAVNSTVYAVNTAGAFFGVLLAGFYLVPTWGLPLSIMGAALVNILAGLFFWVLSGWRPHFNPPEAEAMPEESLLSPPSPAIPLFALWATAFLSGFYMMTLQNVLIRLSALSFGSSSYSFSIIVAIFIFCIAIGSFIVSRLTHIRVTFLYFNQMAIALGLGVIYLSLDLWPYGAHLVRVAFQSNLVGFFSYYLVLFVLLSLFLLLPLTMAGATLPLIFHHLRRDMKTLGANAGYVFSFNTVGCLLGSLIGGIFLFSLFDIPVVYLAAVFLAAISALLLSLRLGKIYLLPAASLAVLVAVFLVTVPFYDKNNFRLGTFRVTHMADITLAGPEVFFREFSATRTVYYRDGVAATVAVLEDGSSRQGRKGRAIIVNGKSDSHTIGDAHTLKLLAHLPLLLAPSRQEVLVIGLGTGVTVGEVALYPEVKQIDVAEISAEVIAAQEHFAEFNRAFYNDPRVRIHQGDALRILARSDRRWDVIISEPSNPWTVGVDQLFTREFYAQVKKNLREGGIFLQWLHTYSADARMLGLVFNTLAREFPQVRVFFGNHQDLLILASSVYLDESHVLAGEKVWANNAKLRESLQEIDIIHPHDLLVREIMVDRHLRKRFAGFGLQTRDNPILHYLAGKLFFLESHVPLEYLLDSETAFFSADYLFNLRQKSLGGSLDPRAFISSRGIPRELPARLQEALRLRAWIARPAQTPLSHDEHAYYRTGLLKAIMNYPAAPLPAGMDLGFRYQVSLMNDHLARFRNWLNAYPLDGYRRLLKEGMEKGKNAEEKNFCRLQLLQLLIKTAAPPPDIKRLAAGFIKNEKGEVILAPEDSHLWHSLKSSWVRTAS